MKHCIYLALLLINFIHRTIANKQDGIAYEIFATHYDCTNPRNLQIYDITNIPQCQLKPTDVQHHLIYLQIYQKSQLRLVHAKECSIAIQEERWKCGSLYNPTDSRYVFHKSATEINLMPITGEQCETAVTTGIFYINNILWNTVWEIPANGQNVVYYIQSNGKQSKDRIDCHEGYAIRYVFRGKITNAILEYNSNNGELIHVYRRTSLYCAVTDGKCTTIFHTALWWNKDSICALALIEETHKRMIYWKPYKRFFLTPVLIGEHRLNGETSPLYTFEIYKDPSQYCTNTAFLLHRTNYEHLFIRILRGGFDMDLGTKKPIVTTLRHTNPHMHTIPYYTSVTYHYYERYNNATNEISLVKELRTDDNTTVIFNRKIERIAKITLLPTSSIALLWNRENGTINYQSAAKEDADFILTQYSRTLHPSELEMLNHICEHDKLKLITILATAKENPHQAGKLLTNNRTTYFEINNAIAYSYQCIEQKTAVYEQTQCYNKIPIYYKNELWFIDPVTRQTHKNANKISCDNNLQNLFHFDTDNPLSWYRLSPHIHKNEPPQLLQTNWNSEIFRDDNPYKGLYNQKAINLFWKQIQLQQYQRDMIEYFKSNIIDSQIKKESNSDTLFKGGFIPIETDLPLSQVLPNRIFTEEFLENFGSLTYYWITYGMIITSPLLIFYCIDILLNLVRIGDIMQNNDHDISCTELMKSIISIRFYHKLIATRQMTTTTQPKIRKSVSFNNQTEEISFASTPSDPNYMPLTTTYDVYPLQTSPSMYNVV